MGLKRSRAKIISIVKFKKLEFSVTLSLLEGVADFINIVHHIPALLPKLT